MSDNSTGKGVKVEIEYCSGWGYESHARDLQNEILEKYPNVEVEKAKGRKTSFEVKINGRLAYSKLQVGKFPEFASVLKAIERASRGEEPGSIDAAKGSCLLM